MTKSEPTACPDRDTLRATAGIACRSRADFVTNGRAFHLQQQRLMRVRMKQGLPLRPIVPVIVYHGVQEWPTARTLRDLTEGPEELLTYTPGLVSHLIDLGRYNDDDLPQEEVTLATVMLLKYIARSELADRLSHILQLLRELLSQPDGLVTFLNEQQQ